MRTRISEIKATVPLAHTPKMTTMTELKSAKLSGGRSDERIQV